MATTDGRGNGAEQGTGAVFLPRVDLLERPEAVELFVEMPGVDEQGVELTVERNELTVRGRPRPVDRGGYAMVRAEYPEGDYERRFALSDQVDREGIEAVIAHGVLRVVLPKARHTVPRRVAVKAG